ncbi:hypothetical protein DFQ27_002135 [Actinomortierella ambigua]|uniref:Uncharacterized protein n=1 Tax=Actinomortierella ambigua TaxID=1343610 RepID=A0A9P6U6L0_9FUNG|nr:hypothetical protein DFQ26_003609 [Actinomortierella ambigua]KAG0262769.1 hypothetical protein DFQ27_002135 [Actinomortierella ambigua]
MSSAATAQVPDNRLILERAAVACQTIDDLRYRLRQIQKRLAQIRALQPSSEPPNEAQKQVLGDLLQEAYTLQFQLSTLLAASEEPIPERQVAPQRRASTKK